MKNIFRIILLIAFSQSILLSQQIPCVDLHLTVSNNAGSSKVLCYGLDTLASDGIDTSLGEMTVPPMPPPEIFEARFNLIPGTESTYKDYRYGVIPYSGVKTHQIQYQIGSGGTSITFEWDMPSEATGILMDVFGGTIVNISMSGTGSATITNLISPLQMIITYNGITPVELNSFTAKLYDSFIKLEWITATEVANYGFDIEKQTACGGWGKIGFVDGNGNSNIPHSYSFIDNDFLCGGVFLYRLKQIDTDGSYEYSDVVEVELLVEDFELFQNYPNPFNPNTVIYFQLAVANKVSLKVYDILGREIETLIDEYKPTGRYETDFNALSLTSGVYFYQLRIADLTATKKMVLLR